MAHIKLTVCDHCDARDNEEHPPLHNIKKRTVKVMGCEVTGPDVIDATPDLCFECFEKLRSLVFNAITQAPRAMETPQ